MPPHYCFRTLTHIFQQLMWPTQNEKTELLTQKNRIKRRIFKVFWSECGDSNPGPPAPKGVLNTFSARLQRFLAIFNLFYLLFDTLISTVSGCSGAVCGNLCGQKRFRPVSGEDSPVSDGKHFAFQTVCIVTLSRRLCKLFLQMW